MNRIILTGLIFLAAISQATAAESPRSVLLQHVPIHHHFGVMLQDAEKVRGKWAESTLVDSIRTSDWFRELSTAPEWNQIAPVELWLKAEFNTNLTEMTRELFGTCIMVIYRDQPKKAADSGEGLVLIWVKNPDKVRKWITKVNSLQRATERSIDVAEGKAYRLREYAGGSDGYYFAGHVLVLSSSQAMLQASIQASLNPSQQAATKVLEAIGAEDALIANWFQPRAFDADLAARIAIAPENERASLLNVQRYWQALDQFGLFLRIEPEIELLLGVAGRVEALPSGGRSLLQSFSQSSNAWMSMSEQTLAVINGPLRWSTIQSMIEEFMTPEAAQRWRAGLEKELAPVFGRPGWASVLASIGPRSGMRFDSSSTTMFPSMLWAIELTPSKQQPAIDQPLFQALEFAMMSWRIAYNRTHEGRDQMFSESIVREGVTIQSLRNDAIFSEGVRPSFAIKDGFLLMAESPESIIRFRRPAEIIASPLGEVMLARVSLMAMRRHLDQHRLKLPPTLVNQSSGNESANLESFLQAFRNVSNLDLGIRSTPGRGQVFLRMKLQQPPAPKSSK